MRLGEMLVQEGVVRAEQLEAALAAQVVHGGRLGTNLVELGALDLDALAAALGRQRGVPAAAQTHFAAIDPAVARALPPVAAARHLAVPLAYANAARTQIVVAFADPQALSSVDEIAFAMSARVQPWVAPELRLLYNLERLYGLRRPNRFVRVDAARTAPAEPPAPTAVGAERRRYVEATPPLADAPPPAPRAPTPPPPPPSAPPPPRTSAPPPARPSVPPARTSVPPQDFQRDSMSYSTFESPAPVTSLGEARLRIAAAETRDAIADALVDYLRSSFGHGLVLMVREGMALGWRGTSPAGGEDAIAIALEAPTLLGAAFRSDGSFVRGEPPSDGVALHARLVALLGDTGVPSEAVVATVAIRRRVVNLVYAHASDHGALRDDAVAGLSSLCDDAATAYTRLLQRARADKRAEPADQLPGPGRRPAG